MSNVKKPHCHNCKFAGHQFKIDKLTHLHCESPEMKEWMDAQEIPNAWESLRVFSQTCRLHQFKEQTK